MEEYIGTSGFTLFWKIDHGNVLALAGKVGRARQYAVGNPLLAVQMSAYVPEIALYAPLRLVVYEDHEEKTWVAYDRITSQLAQYEHNEVARVAEIVELKLEALVQKEAGSAA